ncbi:MAG: 7TM-DISM domain-containing protein [Desulfovibrionaceae bacterium]
MRNNMYLRVFCVHRVQHFLSLSVLAVLLSIFCPGLVGAQTPVPTTLVQAATPMLPYLDWLNDPSGRLTAEDMSDGAQQAAFRPLNLEKMPRETGTVWLRFTLAPRVMDARPGTYLLDMGEGVPGTPTLYIPKHNVLSDTTEWQDFTPSQRSIFLMPDAQVNPVTAYIKMSGMPGLWFAPVLRTPHNAATALERLVRPAVIVMLGVVMLLCLLRGLTERGEWRFWTSLYTGAALLHSVWGVPTVLQGHVPMGEIAAVLAPGVALMLLPHVGRHLMHTREHARIIDLQYILLSLPGAALALLPLVPGFSWTIRYLDLWPLGTLLLVPTTLGAWLMGLAGARRFLLGCLLPPLATALGIVGIGSTVPAPVLATAPLWGVALSALLIAGMSVTYEPSHAEGEKKAPDDVLDDPALRIVSPEELAQENAMPMPEPAMWEKDAAPRVPVDSAALEWEGKLRVPLDSLQREISALSACALPPAARQHAQVVQGLIHGMTEVFSEPLEESESSSCAEKEESVFDLQQILRDAHDSVATSAENKNIALSWFMPPHLATRYVGDGGRLATCTRLLLESAVRATSRGGVQVAVRRVPESVDAGHLLFAVTDTGTGMPPHDRSSMALARTWELAAAHRGFLGVECSPHGTSISFTVRLQVASTNSAGTAEQATPPDAPKAATSARPAAAMPTAGVTAEGAAAHTCSGEDGVKVVQPQAQADSHSALPRIIIADDSLSNRQLLAFFLEGLPYQTQEARSPDEAVDLYLAVPAALVIFDGDMPEEDTLSAVNRIRAFEAEHALPAALALALTTDESRWDTLHQGGFTHALVKPVARTGLRRTVQELLPAGTLPPSPATASAQANSREQTKLADMPQAGTPQGETDFVPLFVESEEEGIIDTGAPLPDSSPVSKAFTAPLSMSADDDISLPSPATGMPIPLMDVPNEIRGTVSVEDSDDVTVENVYPYPSHMGPAVETVAEGVAAAQLGVIDAPPSAPPHEPVSPIAATPTKAPSFSPSPVFKAGPDVEAGNMRDLPFRAPSNVAEWVGEPMPIAKVPAPIAVPAPAQGPSRVPDLLTPYTPDSAHASEASLADTGISAPDSRAFNPSKVQSTFVPLSFPSATAEYSPVLASAPKAERLSLLSEESPLLDFIIAAPTLTPKPAMPTSPVRAEKSSTPSPSASGVQPRPDPAPVSTAPVAAAEPTEPIPDVDSPIPIMLEEFDEAMRYARGGFARNNIQAVQEAAAYIANRSETCGLRVLARMARCVGEAAKAEDKEALKNLLPELETAVERNKIALLKK